MRSTAVLVLLALFGCNGNEEPDPIDTGTDDTGTGDDTGTEDVDADGDGFLASEDCDDDDASAYPGGTELCDGVDNDCDDTTPETDMATWWPADGSAASDIATDLAAGTVDAVVDWQAPSSGTLALCGDTYYVAFTAGEGQDLTIQSGSAASQARIANPDAVAVTSVQATSVTLRDLEIEADLCVNVQCSSDACDESGSGGAGTQVNVHGVLADACVLYSDDNAATLNLTDSEMDGTGRSGSQEAIHYNWGGIAAQRTNIHDYPAGVDVTLFGDFSFTDGTIHDSNQSGNHGAAIRLVGNSTSNVAIDLTGSTFEDNTADGRRYALYVEDFAEANLTGGTFDSNEVEFAAIGFNVPIANVDGTTVTNHTVRALSAGEMRTLTNMTVTDNTGGGISLGVDEPTIATTVSNTTLYRNGGTALQVYGQDLTVTDVDFGTGADANTDTDFRYESETYDFEGVTSASCADFSCD